MQLTYEQFNYDHVKARIHTVSPVIQQRILDNLPIAFPDVLQDRTPLDPQWTRVNYPLYSFLREAWVHIEPHDFQDGWHIEAECLHLEAVTESAAANPNSPYPVIRNLLMNVPPRTSKSLTATVFWPAWVWITWPAAQFLCTSYSSDLSMRDAVKCRQLMMSEWYQERWGDQWRLTTDQNLKSYYANNKGGYRISTSVTGKATGFGGDFIIGDDLHETTEDLSTTRAEIETAKGHWLTSIPSRVTNPASTCKVLIGQRVADDDVSQAVLDLDLEDEYRYVHLNIPMEYESDDHNSTVLWSDPRTEDGEVIDPIRFPSGYIAEQKAALGHRWFAQYQQKPTVDSETLFPEDKWRYFDTWPDVDWFDLLVQSWDFRTSEQEQDEKKHQRSWVAGHLWALKGSGAAARVFLLDRFIKQVGFADSCQAVRDMSAKWPGAYSKLIEQQSNGPAVYATVRSKVFGVRLVPVGGKHGGKYARAAAVSLIQAEGRAWLPSFDLAPWVKDYVRYMRRFPAKPNDDGDATSQAWHELCPPPPMPNTAQEERERRQALEVQIRRRIRDARAYSRTGV